MSAFSNPLSLAQLSVHSMPVAIGNQLVFSAGQQPCWFSFKSQTTVQYLQRQTHRCAHAPSGIRSKQCDMFHVLTPGVPYKAIQNSPRMVPGHQSLRDAGARMKHVVQCSKMCLCFCIFHILPVIVSNNKPQCRWSMWFQRSKQCCLPGIP